MFDRMLDKTAQPTVEEMTAYCGERGALFSELQAFLLAQPDITREVRFPYGNKYGWSTVFREKKKLLCDVFAEEGAFTVMLRLSDKQFASVYADLQPYTHAYIDGKYPCGDGGWIHYRVLEKEHLADILALLKVKIGQK